MATISLALISATFPGTERGQAIDMWSGFSGITAALGPWWAATWSIAGRCLGRF